MNTNIALSTSGLVTGLADDIDVSIAEYLLDVQARGCAVATRDKYDHYLRLWHEWLTGRGLMSLDHLTRLTVREWAAGLHEQGNWSAATIRLAVTIVKGFLAWCYEERLMEADISRSLKPPAPVEVVQRTIHPDEADALLNACDETPLGIRNAAIISMLYDTGFRATELCQLRVEDLHFDVEMRGMLVNYGVVLLKGGDEGYGWFEHEARVLLERWLKLRARLALADVPEVFVSLGGNTPGSRLSRYGLYQIMRSLSKKAGIEPVSVHAFRRGFTVALDDAGASDNLKAKLGRWKSTAMIQRYTRAQRIGWQFPEYSPMKNRTTEHTPRNR